MSDAITIVTNWHARDVIDAWQLSESERAEFDYLNWRAIEAGEDSATFFRYRGELYDLGEFFTTSPGAWNFGLPDEFKGWSGYRSDSFFSGMLVRYVDEFERVIVARYFS